VNVCVTALGCPVCGEPLIESASQYACNNGHQFDRSRTGYVNLLPTTRRRASGDSREMLEARRRFLSRGHYAPIAAWILESSHGVLLNGPGTLLDVGCGEGYYLRQLMGTDELAAARGYGIDISKAAVHMASTAGRSGEVRYAIANAYRLPVVASSIDIVVKVFSPAGGDEAHRILSARGVVAEVLAAPDHMIEIRKLLYRHDRPHDDTSSLSHSEGFAVTHQTRIKERLISRSDGDFADLLAMSPYRFAGDEQGRAQVARLPSVTLDVYCRLLERAGQ
jgi:23S rRNA (guanine745-N1)-methyltransferase